MQLERSPTIPELAKAASVEEEEVLEALETGQAYATLSLSAPERATTDSDLDPLESLGEIEHEYEVSEDRAVLAPGLRALDERERKILHLRFFEGLTQSQIAQQVGISQMHVSRLIRRSLEKIRDEIATEQGPGAAPRAAARPLLESSVCARPRSCARASAPSSSRRATIQALACRSSRARTTARRSSRRPGMQPQMPVLPRPRAAARAAPTTVQKVFRTPDIDEVGIDGHHLTFFEMLGNFSFGQYFKEGAIELAWEFMFDHLKLDRDRIWVTVFAGDPELGLGEDEVAIGLWEGIGMPPSGSSASRAENFWSVGGPGAVRARTRRCSTTGARASAAADPGVRARVRLRALPRVLEPRLHGVRAPRGRHADAAPPAEHRHGHGPRAARAILQDVASVYETDGYQAIMAWIAEQSGVAYGDRSKRRRPTGSSPTTGAG